MAGVEIKSDHQTLLVDPYFTRFPAWRMFVGPVTPDRGRITRYVQDCDYVLVTHPHWDHLMDVPEVLRSTGARAFGSKNACGLLALHDIPESHFDEIRARDRLELGPFDVTVYAAMHGKTPLDHRINGSLSPDLKPPLRAFDYRMDACFSFLVDIAGFRILIGPGESAGHYPPANVIVVGTILTTADPASHFKALLDRVRPAVVIPYHWDDMFRPLSKPIRPMLNPPAWKIPPITRVDLHAFREMIQHLAPGTTVIVPEIFRKYTQSDLRN